MKNEMPDLTKTAEAVREYDREESRYVAKFDRHINVPDAEKAFAKLEAAQKVVGITFMTDTADRNSMDDASLITPDGNNGWLRRMLFNQGFEDCAPSPEVRAQRGWGW